MPPTAEAFDTYRDELALDLARFAPELFVVAAIALVLLARLTSAFDRRHLWWIAAVPLAAALQRVAFPHDFDWKPAFGGLLRFDAFAGFLRGLVLVFALAAVVLGRLTRLPDEDDSADYLVLLLGGTLGLMVMASANHLLTAYLGMEMASVPSYVLAGFLKGRRTGSEAALKYVLYGSAASAFALFGISLLFAKFGTGSLPGVAVGYGELLRSGSMDALAAGGLLLLLVGFGFKLSVVPFHFWCPDVFAAAAAEVAAFLAAASKAAAVGLTARVLLLLQSHSPDASILPGTLGLAIGIVAALSATFGNLAALAQTDLQRMLAYSTIAHAGYMLMALATLGERGVAGAFYYLAAYLPANLATFGVIAFLRPKDGNLTLDGLKGLTARRPMLGIAFAVAMLSLLGLPPLAGFAGKFQVFEAVYEAGKTYPNLRWLYDSLLAIGVANTALSAGFYLRAVRAATMDEPEGTPEANEPRFAGFYAGGMALAIVALGLAWNPVARLAATAAHGR